MAQQDVQEVETDFSGLGKPVIDCDLHNEVPKLEALFPYLEDHWVAYISAYYSFGSLFSL